MPAGTVGRAARELSFTARSHAASSATVAKRRFPRTTAVLASALIVVTGAVSLPSLIHMAHDEAKKPAAHTLAGLPSTQIADEELMDDPQDAGTEEFESNIERKIVDEGLWGEGAAVGNAEDADTSEINAREERKFDRVDSREDEVPQKRLTGRSVGGSWKEWETPKAPGLAAKQAVQKAQKAPAAAKSPQSPPERTPEPALLSASLPLNTPFPDCGGAPPRMLPWQGHSRGSAVLLILFLKRFLLHPVSWE